MAEYRGGEGSYYGSRPMASYVRPGGEQTGIGSQSYGRQMNTPPRQTMSPIPAAQTQGTPMYAYPSGATTYTTPSLNRYNPGQSSPTISRGNPQPYPAAQQPGAGTQYRRESYQAVPLSNPDTFRPAFSEYSGSGRQVSPVQQPSTSTTQAQQRVSYARTQGNFNSPTASTINNSGIQGQGSVSYQPQQNQPSVQRPPVQMYSASQQNIGNRSASAIPIAGRFQVPEADRFGNRRDKRDCLQEMWATLEGNRDLQRTAKNMLTESVEMLVAISRTLTSALLDGANVQELGAAHKRGIDLWRQEIARRYPVEPPFALREWIGKDADFLSDLANGFKKRGDSQSRTRERTIHLERSSSNMQTGFIELDSGVQTPTR